jgi:hypothetical protein
MVKKTLKKLGREFHASFQVTAVNKKYGITLKHKKKSNTTFEFIKVFFIFTNGYTIYLFRSTLKFTLKFTLKLLLHISV